MRKRLGYKLRPENYNQSIVLPNSWKSALIPWFANIPIRTGWRGEMRYGLLNDIRILDKSKLPLMVQRYVSLAYPASQVAKSSDYPIPLMEAETASYQLPPSKKRLILCPGAEFGPAKQWPTQHFAEVAQQLINEDWQVVILGSQADIDTANDICHHMKTASDRTLINLCGKTELQQAIDLIATADVVISNDSGLMHITAALQKPLIAIYGPTSPGFTPPLAKNATILQLDVDCGPCFQRECPEKHHKCMRNISSKRVLELIKDNHQIKSSYEQPYR
jgi:heptosyltransferase-2